jgi:hypothetical protein
MNMKQLKAEKRIIATWMGYLQKDPTWSRLIWKSWKVFLFRIAAIVLLAWLLLASQLTAPAYLVVGILIGSLIRDIEWFRNSAKIWPVVKTYLNWEKISAAHAAQTKQETTKVEPAPPGYVEPGTAKESKQSL